MKPRVWVETPEEIGRVTASIRLAEGLGNLLLSCADLAAPAGYRTDAKALIDLAYALFASRLERVRCRGSHSLRTD